MMFIKYVCRVPLRMTEEELLAGDDAVHGEAAYTLLEISGHHHSHEVSTTAESTEKGLPTKNGAEIEGEVPEASTTAHV